MQKLRCPNWAVFYLHLFLNRSHVVKPIFTCTGLLNLLAAEPTTYKPSFTRASGLNGHLNTRSTPAKNSKYRRALSLVEIPVKYRESGIQCLEGFLRILEKQRIALAHEFIIDDPQVFGIKKVTRLDNI